MRSDLIRMNSLQTQDELMAALSAVRECQQNLSVAVEMIDKCDLSVTDGVVLAEFDSFATQASTSLANITALVCRWLLSVSREALHSDMSED
jgi:hypothetical protein